MLEMPGQRQSAARLQILGPAVLVSRDQTFRRFIDVVTGTVNLSGLSINLK